MTSRVPCSQARVTHADVLAVRHGDLGLSGVELLLRHDDNVPWSRDWSIVGTVNHSAHRVGNVHPLCFPHFGEGLQVVDVRHVTFYRCVLHLLDCGRGVEDFARDMLRYSHPYFFFRQ